MIFDSYGNAANNDGSMINQPLNGALADLGNNTATPDLVSGGASKNFVTGQSGWQITNDGNAEFNNINARGTISAGNGTVLIDSTGISSSNNFKSASISGLPNQTTTSSSYVAVNGGTMNSFTVSRSTNVFVYVTFNGANNGFVNSNPVNFVNFNIADLNDSNFTISSACFGRVSYVFNGTGNITSTNLATEPIFQSQVVTFSAGTHQLQLQMKIGNGGTALAAGFNMGYLFLGS